MTAKRRRPTDISDLESLTFHLTWWNVFDCLVQRYVLGYITIQDYMAARLLFHNHFNKED
jgi:hypothetical protein